VTEREAERQLLAELQADAREAMVLEARALVTTLLADEALWRKRLGEYVAMQGPEAKQRIDELGGPAQVVAAARTSVIEHGGVEAAAEWMAAEGAHRAAREALADPSFRRALRAGAHRVAADCVTPDHVAQRHDARASLPRQGDRCREPRRPRRTTTA
jgi:hypothetical protein